MNSKVRIRKDQRGLLFRFGDFVKLLAPGQYRFWSRFYSGKQAAVEVVSVLETSFEHPKLDLMLDEPGLRAALEVVEPGETQRAIVWRDGRIYRVLGPGRYAFWKEPFELRVETFEARDPIPTDVLEPLAGFSEAAKEALILDVDPGEEALVFCGGALVDRVGSGRHAWWNGSRRLTWKSVDLRERILDVSGQDIMSRDKVTLRLNLVVTYRVADALKALTFVSDFESTLYREAQLALRAQVGTRTLEALLESKESLGEELAESIRPRVGAFGLELRSVGLKDVILPGDMKAILNQVIVAEKEAQANLIRRREETAAARSQANTARLLADNPVLARMKELEMVQAIVAGAKTSFVLGSGSLIDNLRQVVGTEDGPESSA